MPHLKCCQYRRMQDSRKVNFAPGKIQLEGNSPCDPTRTGGFWPGDPNRSDLVVECRETNPRQWARDNNSNNDHIYIAVVMAKQLHEFTWFVQWLHTDHQVTSPKTKPSDDYFLLSWTLTGSKHGFKFTVHWSVRISSIRVRICDSVN